MSRYLPHKTVASFGSSNISLLPAARPEGAADCSARGRTKLSVAAVPLLGLHLPMAGEGLNRIGAELLHPFAKDILVNVQVSRSLRRRDPALLDKLDCLDLELSTKLASLHHPPPAS
jgi:hypothetical protein